MRVFPAFSSRWRVLVLVGLVAFGSGPARAQQGTLRGLVVDSVGKPIRDADVGIVVARRLVRTDEQGRFAFEKLPLGDLDVSFRRLGFEPRIVRVAIVATAVDSLHVIMKANVALLSTVDVTATELRLRQSIEDFYRRRIQGTGQYITREQIEARWGGTPSDMLRNTPGIRLVRSATGGYAVRFPNTSLSRNDCAPLIWVDGQKAPGMEIDDIPLRDVEGIELYSGPATTPMQFTSGQNMTQCGTIVVWSRPPQYQRYNRAP